MTFRPKPMTIVSACLLVLSFPPWNFSALIWIALLPWLLVLRQTKSLKEGLIQGIWLSLLMTVGGFYWVAFAIHRYGQMPLAVGFLGLFLFGLFNQIQFVLFGAAFAKGQKRWPSPLFWATVYTLIDAAMPKLFQDSLGHSQWNAPWVRGWASVAGVTSITFAILLFQNLLSRYSRPRIALAYVWLGIIVVGGHSLMQRTRSAMQAHTQHIPMAILQANVGDFEKVAARLGHWGGSDHILDTHFRMGDAALQMEPKPRVIIWAETAYPSAFRAPNNSRELAQDQKVESFVRSRNVPLWFGGYDHKAGKDYNAVFFLSPWMNANDSDLVTYHKHVLLPFGETIPFLDDGGPLRQWIPNMGFFGRGPGPQVVELPLSDPKGSNPMSIRVAPIICYEALIEWFTREAALKGAQVFLNVTNDSWFGNTAEPYLHMVLTIFRSIETQLTQIRATNTGVTVVIDAAGDLHHQSELFQESVIHAQVPVHTPQTPTLYVRGGKTWFLALLGLILVGQVGHMRWPGGLHRLSKKLTRPRR